MEFNAKLLFKPIIAASLLLATIFTATGHLDRMINSTGLERLTRSNDQYLEASFNRSLKGFLLLSTLKSGIAVLEGSEVGVGFLVNVKPSFAGYLEPISPGCLSLRGVSV